MPIINVLGAYGTKGEGHETTCFALNDTHYIDAGNLLKGVGTQCAHIDTIWLTHSHLDHIVDIAYVIDIYFEDRKVPLKIAGLPQTLAVLKKHFLNELIWPDFSNIPLLGSQQKAIEFVPIELGKRYKISQNEYIEPFKTNHTVPSCGYIVTKEDKSIAITADTYKNSKLWDMVNSREDIKALIIECSFESKKNKLAKESKHLTPELLNEELEHLTRRIPIYVNHIKPRSEMLIRKELASLPNTKGITVLDDNMSIIF